MDSSFWLDKWQHGEIGFHQPDGHSALPGYWPRLQPAAAGRVLVPLCGKARDLAWLAERGDTVHGVELSESAAAQFFAESGLEPSVENRAGHKRYRAQWAEGGEVIIDVGDFFEVPAVDECGFDLFFDRAALIALPPDTRRHYVARIADCLAPHARGLLVTLEYPSGVLNGPPFSIGLDEIDTLFSGTFDVEHIATHDVLADYPGFAAQGLSWLVEHVVILKN